MALELRQQLKLSQQLVMTPQLQQAIKLLQLSRVELLETVQQELLENPFLEEAPANEPVAPQDQEESRHEKPQDEVYDEDLSRNADWEEYLGEFASTPRTSQGRELEIAEEISPLEARYSAKPTLEGHLLWQLHLSTLTDEQKARSSSAIWARRAICAPVWKRSPRWRPPRRRPSRPCWNACSFSTPWAWRPGMPANACWCS